jgi:hypothetical protein
MHAGLPFHPLSNIFPLLEGPAYDALVEDIRVRGLQEPVVLYQKQVLDGRNRQRACLESSTPLRTVPYDGDDPLAFVISANLHRRHLDESQRSLVAKKLANWKLGHNQHTAGSANLQTQANAAKLLNVSVRSLAHAAVVLKKAQPEIVAAVEQGVMAVSTAASIANKPREKQLARLERDLRKANGTNRQEDDFYRTPPECTRALLRKEKFRRSMWEPACGDGAISRVLVEAGHTVVSTDLIDRGYGEGGLDFLTEQKLRASDLATNPPYERADEFALHALNLGVRKMALLCRLAWLEGQERYDRLYSQQKLARVWVFSRRQTLWRGDDEAAEADGGMTAYAWFVFERDHSGAPTLGWLS